MNRIKPSLGKHTGWVVAYAAVYSAVLVLIQNLFDEKWNHLGAGVILFFIVAVIMIRWYHYVPVILWISLGALILYAWDINPWHYYFFGDRVRVLSIGRPYCFPAHSGSAVEYFFSSMAAATAPTRIWFRSFRQVS